MTSIEDILFGVLHNLIFMSKLSHFRSILIWEKEGVQSVTGFVSKKTSVFVPYNVTQCSSPIQ